MAYRIDGYRLLLVLALLAAGMFVATLLSRPEWSLWARDSRQSALRKASRRRRFAILWHMPHQCVVPAIPDGALECLMKDPAAPGRVDLVQLELERGDVPRRPPRDDRRVEAAELRDVEERPGALDSRDTLGRWQARDGDRCQLADGWYRRDPLLLDRIGCGGGLGESGLCRPQGGAGRSRHLRLPGI